MESVIAIFRSRTETMSFANLMKSYGARVLLINTPRKANVSCGISAQFAVSSLSVAQTVLARRNFISFAGFYRTILQANGDIDVVPLPRI